MPEYVKEMIKNQDIEGLWSCGFQKLAIRLELQALSKGLEVSSRSEVPKTIEDCLVIRPVIEDEEKFNRFIAPLELEGIKL